MAVWPGDLRAGEDACEGLYAHIERRETPYTPAASPTQLQRQQQAYGRVQVYEYVLHAHDVRRRLLWSCIESHFP